MADSGVAFEAFQTKSRTFGELSAVSSSARGVIVALRSSSSLTASGYSAANRRIQQRVITAGADRRVR